MGLFGFGKKDKDNFPYLYSGKELDEYEKHIAKSYGEYSTVLHEVASPDIHLDVITVPPTEDAHYYKLVTMGAGAYSMKVPKELKKNKLEHAEYVMYLPADWNIESNAPEDYWPIGMLKKIARLPIDYDTWLGYGHTIHGNADASPIAADTKMNSFMLVVGMGLDLKCSDVQLSSGRYINMYQVIPLYQEELEYKKQHDASALLDLFPPEEFPPIVHPQRENVCLNNE